MHADHINTVKFRSRSDEGYQKILDFIQIMTWEAPDKVDSQWEKEDRVKAGTWFLIRRCYSMNTELLQQLTSSSSNR
jgi:hypothetical protein